MSQEYTPVDWVDETTSQQGTLINAARLDQMQTAHHYADGFEEVDAIPTEDPGVDYHKVVYCTADTTFYRWDGTEWTADIDEDTKRLLEQEIARATAAEGELAQDVEDEATARANADTALGGRIDAETEARETADRQITEDIGRLNGETLPLYRNSSTPTIQNAGAANEGAITNLAYTVEGLEASKADKADTYTKAQADTLLAGKVDKLVSSPAGTYKSVTVNAQGQVTAGTNPDTLAGFGITDAYTKTETDTLLATKADTTALTDGSVTKLGTADLGTDTKPIKLVGGVPTAVTNDLVSTSGNQTVGGVKTFTSAPIALGNSLDLSAINLRNNNITLAPMTGGHNTSVEFRGQSNALLARLRYRTGTGDQRNMYVDLYDANNTAHVFTLCQLLGGVESYPALDGYAPMVRTSGNQTIGGTKFFSSKINGIVTGGDTSSSESMTVGYYKSVYRISRATLSTFRGVATIATWQRAAGASLEFVTVAFHGNTAVGINRFGFESKTCDYFVSADDNYVYIGLKATQTTLSSTSKQLSVIATGGFNAVSMFEGYDGTASATVEGTLIAETS